MGVGVVGVGVVGVGVVGVGGGASPGSPQYSHVWQWTDAQQRVFPDDK